MAKRGDEYKDDHGTIRVMAVADGYCLCRRPGRMPFVRTEKEVNAFIQMTALLAK